MNYRLDRYISYDHIEAEHELAEWVAEMMWIDEMEGE